MTKKRSNFARKSISSDLIFIAMSYRFESDVEIIEDSLGENLHAFFSAKGFESGVRQGLKFLALFGQNKGNAAKSIIYHAPILAARKGKARSKFKIFFFHALDQVVDSINLCASLVFQADKII